MKYYLSVVAIFKNEHLIMKEWLEHYLIEGVEHFYLIDNGSTDQYQELVKTYQQEHLIEIQMDSRVHRQEEHYNEYYLNKVKTESEWVMVVDFDEFIYSRPPYRKISDYLRTLGGDVSQIYVPWKIYGSSGHLQQPDSCVDHFVMRTRYQTTKTNGMVDPYKILVKTVTRTSRLVKMSIHCAVVMGGGSREITSDNRPLTTPGIFQPINEDILNRSVLHCNHYPIQSYDWFRQIKMTRGSATSALNDKVRTIEYFNSFETHGCQLLDDELTKKHNQLKVYYGAGQYLDVTRQVYRLFLDSSGHKLVIHEKVSFNQCFGDPMEHTVKYLVVRRGPRLEVYPENNHGRIEINL